MRASDTWQNADGVRCCTIEGKGDEVFVQVDDLAKFIQNIDPAAVEPEKRAAIVEFRKRSAVMPPAVAHRAAVALLESFGAELPEDFRTLRPREVR